MADYLMERGGERMNVPRDKVEAFKAEGWRVLKAPDENKTAPVVDQPVVEMPEYEEGEEDEPESKPAAKRGRKAK